MRNLIKILVEIILVVSSKLNISCWRKILVWTILIKDAFKILKEIMY